MEIFGLGAPELLLILIVFLLFFGKDKLPELARSIGTSFKELKSGFSGSVDSSNSSKPPVTPVSQEKREANNASVKSK